jgi:hypothetical protein
MNSPDLISLSEGAAGAEDEDPFSLSYSAPNTVLGNYLSNYGQE